jgi:anti-sigma B factor antagonist
MTNNGDLSDLPASFACSWALHDRDAAWVHLAGELDLASAPALRDTLRDAETRAQIVLLDLRDLTFMDSAGVHAIVRACVRAQRAGRRLILVRGPRQVDRLLALAGVADRLEIDDSPREPPADLGSRQTDAGLLERQYASQG